MISSLVQGISGSGNSLRSGSSAIGQVLVWGKSFVSVSGSLSIRDGGISSFQATISLGPGVGSVSSLVIDGRCSGYLSASRIHLVSACLSVLKSGSWSGYSSVYSAFLSLGTHWEVESALELKAALVPRFFLLSDLSAMLSSLMIVPQYCREFLGTLSMLDFSGISSALGLVKVFPLSISSVLIPFSSFNQSPRNIYQSSMAKQSISLPVLFLRSLMLDSVARSLGPVANLTRQPVRGRRCGEGFDLE